MPCNCRHKYQDREYGKDQRIHNRAVKKEQWRCTVCGTLRSVFLPKKEEATRDTKKNRKKGRDKK